MLATVPKISAQELFARLGTRDMSLLVLDVRGAEEYAAGHVPGARNLPHDEVGARAGELRVAKDAGQQIVVYCRSGRRAALAIEALRKAGFEKLAHLEGDYMGWEAAGLEVARGRVASDAKGDSGASREPTPR